MRMPPLLADFIHAGACIPICEKFLTLPIFIVDAELLAVKDNQLFIPAALEIFDRFQIFFQFIGNSGLGRTLTVLFVGFPNITDNPVEVIQNHVAEILIIADMGSLQHLQMRVIFAGAIPFNDFMPDGIDKGVEVLNLHGGNPVHINLNVCKKLDKILCVASSQSRRLLIRPLFRSATISSFKCSSVNGVLICSLFSVRHSR